MCRMITKDAYTEEQFQQLIGRESARVELKTGASASHSKKQWWR
jgi:hypothetical protein